MKEKSLLGNSLCSTCLCPGRDLHNISDMVSKQFYLSVIQELPFQRNTDSEPQICWECNALLKRVILFKEQIKDCYNILQRYNNENISDSQLTDVSRSPRLTIKHVSSVNLAPEQCDEDDVLSTVKQTVKNEGVKKEWEICLVKCEDNSSDDFKDENEYSDYDLSDISDISDISVNSDNSLEDMDEVIGTSKNGKSRAKSKKSSNKRKVKKEKSSALQKIKTIELTYEEMLLERERETVKHNYVNAEFKCELCLMGFNYEKSYKTHNKRKHSQNLGDYNCPVCKTVLANVESFTAHYKRHLRRYECLECGKRTMDRKFIMQHYETIHEGKVKEYKCDICGKLSNTIDAHRYHKGTHKQRAACEECNKTFSHRAGLMNHRLAVHKRNKGYPCTLCDKKFRWKGSLSKHMRKHIKKDDSLSDRPVCEPCGITFASICSLQRHLKNSLKHVTEDELKYICDDCNRKFSDKTKLRDHIEEKHLHRTYQCPICLKPSKNRVCLDQHVRNVHRGRPKNKICHHCGKAFPTQMQLDSHIRTHTGEKPFICEYCPTTFSQQSNLYKHNRQVHMTVKTKRYSVCRKRKNKTEQPVVPEVPNYNRDVPALSYDQVKHEFVL